jgi:hypothetical protein
MRIEYVVVSFIIAMIIILLAVSMLTGIVPGLDSVLGLFRKEI